MTTSPAGRSANPAQPPDPTAPGRVEAAAEWSLRIMTTLLGTFVAVGSAVVAGFLTPFRLGTTVVPVSWAVVVLGVFAGIWVARYGAATPGAAFFPAAAALFTLWRLSAPMAPGDPDHPASVLHSLWRETLSTGLGYPVIPGTWVGVGTLLSGFTALLVALFLMVVRPPVGPGERKSQPGAANPPDRAPGQAGPG